MVRGPRITGLSFVVNLNMVAAEQELVRGGREVDRAARPAQGGAVAPADPRGRRQPAPQVRLPRGRRHTVRAGAVYFGACSGRDKICKIWCQTRKKAETKSG